MSLTRLVSLSAVALRPTRFLIMVALATACDRATDAVAPSTHSSSTPPSATADARVPSGSSVSVDLTFHEPIVPIAKRGDCPVAAEGFCGSGEVIPFGQATESIEFGGACGGGCDLRIIQLPQGSITLEETFSDPGCPGTCQPNPAFPGNGRLTDVIVSGTGLFQGATGTLAGTVRAAGRESTVRLSGTIALASRTAPSPALAAARSLVDPGTLIPVPPPGAVCHAVGGGTICQTYLTFEPVNEPAGSCWSCRPPGNHEERFMKSSGRVQASPVDWLS